MKRDWCFLGVYMTQVEFAVAMANKKQGVCPFCGRTGLTPRYGSINKHIKACANKRKCRVCGDSRCPDSETL